MATTIYAAFDELLGWLSTTPTETQSAKDRRASIDEALREEFGSVGFFRTGSFENGTSVFRHSSVDAFAVLPEASSQADSHQLLVTIAAAMRVRFPNTGIRVDSPAVVLPFGRDLSDTTKVIPAVEVGLTESGYRQFVIPDGSGGWMAAAPDAHGQNLGTLDQAHGGRAKSLIRLLKGWKHLGNVPISSFYLELIAADYARTQDTIINDIDLRNVFERILATGLAPYPNPGMPAQILAPCKTAPLQAEALAHVRDAAAWSREAVTLNFGGDGPAAFLRWDRVFTTHFPPFR